MSAVSPKKKTKKKASNNGKENGEANGNGKRRRKVTAESMAKSQRDISVSEFFAKNRHLLGFVLVACKYSEALEKPDARY